jgi:exopolysaccharide biosynthesis predicted pyruvyltransferase EpsI
MKIMKIFIIKFKKKIKSQKNKWTHDIKFDAFAKKIKVPNNFFVPFLSLHENKDTRSYDPTNI